MLAADLPNRRVEAWKYSDLRAALAGTVLPAAVLPSKQGWRALDGVIDRLALAQGAHEVTIVKAGEKAFLLEELFKPGLDARVREIQVQPGGALTRVVVQRGTGVSLSAAYVSVGEGARFSQFILAEGAKLARIETSVEVEGEGAEVRLNGVYLCAGVHADLTSRILHRAPNGVTRQMIKGASRKGGRGVFQGRIEVARAAQKTDARQYHHGLLLEEGAEIYAKPELEIYADDVQCAHGNTAGALDEAALFYMRSRGIGEAAARALLTEAFLLEAVPEDLPGREEIVSRIQAWLGGGT
jgi:Fe-S cluster assembly protein SufD